MNRRRIHFAWLVAAIMLSACGSETVAKQPVKLVGPTSQEDAQIADVADSAVPGPCTSSKDCPADQVCDGVVGKCVDCNHDADCAANQRCSSHVCLDVTPCKSDKACSALGGVCDAEAGLCVECLGDADCAADLKCKQHHCTPPPATCATSKDCAATEQVCDKSLGICVDCTSAGDCTPGNVCVDGSCMPPICVPGSHACIGLDRVGSCDAAGSSRSNEPCPLGEKCEDGACKPVVCVPGTQSCDGDTKTTCSPRGLSWQKTPCASGESCVAGSCKLQKCKAGEKTCQNGVLTVCQTDGTGWDEQACPAKSSCATVGATVQCSPWTCTPGSVACAGAVVSGCSANGLVKTELDNCDKPGPDGKPRLCVDGKCLPGQCKPGSQMCEGGQLLTCKADALGWSQAACPAGQVCEGKSCSVIVCAPGEQDCEAGGIQTCNPNGTDWATTKECKSTEVCVVSQGKASCKTKICTPGTATCSADGLVLLTCANDGLSVSSKACQVGTACDGGACLVAVCTPGKAKCDGNVVRACTSKGQLGDIVADCADDKVCIDAACAAKKCAVGQKVCSAVDKIVECVANVGWQEKPCPAATSCSAGACKPHICAPGKKLCEGKQSLQCDSVGLTKALVEDCATSAKVCQDGLCVVAGCGDGKLNQIEEQCDDGNAKDGDGCSAGCQKEATCSPACAGGYACLGSGVCGLPCTLAGPCGQGAGGSPFATLDGGSNGLKLGADGKLTGGGGVNLEKMGNLWASNSPESTVSKVAWKTVKEVGRYKVCTDPSRTAVDWNGDAWIGCRAGGNVAKIAGDVSHCVDKNGNGTIETSQDLNGDGSIQPNEMVTNDECVLFITPVLGETTRAAGIDKDNNAWIGFYSSKTLKYLKGTDGSVLATVALPCPPYGLAIAPNGVVWVQGPGCGLVSYDPATKAINKYNPPFSYGAYGINVDAKGRIWLGGSFGGSGAISYDPKSLQWVKCAGVPGSAGIATAKDGMVYVALDCGGGVGKIDGDKCWATGGIAGSYLGAMSTGGCPHGVAVDFDGFVWGVNWQQGNSVGRADPNNMKAAPLTRTIGNAPYTYSDMTGYALQYLSPSSGMWTGTFFASDVLNPFSGQLAAFWKNVAVEMTVAAGATVTLRIRAADNAAALSSVDWKTVGGSLAASGSWDLTGLAKSAILQVELTVTYGPNGGATSIGAVKATWANKP